jgi:predicted P-type ATPase
MKQFTFSSSLLRMSVICQELDIFTSKTQFCVYVKGAPEKIHELCRQETIPDNFDDKLHSYTANGYRVIALAGKKLPPNTNWTSANKLKRDNVEMDLTFYGFLIMQNKLKVETPSVINELQTAGLVTVMVTGDNILTAICVGRESGMIPVNNKVIEVNASFKVNSTNDDDENNARIDWKLIPDSTREVEKDVADNDEKEIGNLKETVLNLNNIDNYNFAMTGKSFAVIRRYFPAIYEKILVNGTIYARMSPDQKAQLVEDLMKIGYCVSMCGDGANDCGALKAAHVGVSLSEAEASVAAPFTSKIQNISCIPHLIKEGRTSLVTSFGVFKYMALYSMIQFVSVLILYTFMTNLSDPQFLYVDLFLITPVAIFMSANKAYETIANKRPIGSLIGFVNICSITFQIVLVIIFQVFTVIYVRQQSWYRPHIINHEHFKLNNKSMEATGIFLVSTYLYVIMAIVYSKGPPYRRPISDNFMFIFVITAFTAFNIWITVAPLEFMKKLLTLETLDPMNEVSLFRLTLVGIALLFFISSYFVEVSLLLLLLFFF